jgi:hypothetical protein
MKNRTMVEVVAELLLAEEEIDGEDLDLVCGAVEEGLDWRDELADFRRRRAWSTIQATRPRRR